MTTPTPWTPYDQPMESLKVDLSTNSLRGEPRNMARFNLLNCRLQQEGYRRALADLAPLIEAARNAADQLDRATVVQDRSVGIIKQLCAYHAKELRDALAKFDAAVGAKEV